MAFQWKWLRGEFDDPVESRSFAALRVDLNGDVVTRSYDRITEAERDTVNVALYPLALAIAENWWSLLYEPRKSHEHDSLIEVRHSLDSYMNGFIFPTLALWSGGHDVITVEHPNARVQHSNLEFLPTSSAVTHLQREEVEQNLFELVRSVAERIPENVASAQLRDALERLLQSFQNEDEQQYCQAAGRLGVDPYDPDIADLSEFDENLSDRLFSDICEAAKLSELRVATDWARECTRQLKTFPEVDISHFGLMPERTPLEKIWTHGYEAARLVRRNLHLEGTNPRGVIDKLFGAAVRAESSSIGPARSFAVEAIANRRNGAMRVAIPAVSARWRRSRLCRASYLVWKTAEGDSSAVTTATTFDQQASRAFAAELLAPAKLLEDLAGPDGLTPEKIESFAEKNVCPEQTIIWQAHNHGIPLRGIALPTSRTL